MFSNEINATKLAVFFGCLLIVGVFMVKKYKAPKNSNKDTIVVGMMSGWPPYMSINKQGVFEGFDVDVANQVAKEMKKSMVINDLGSLESLFIALEKGKIDMIFSGLDITKKRLEKFEMVPYTGEGIQSFYLLFWQQIPDGVTAIEDLKNIKNNTICVEPASPSENFLAQPKFDAIDKKSISSVTGMILELKYGRSLAAILEPIAAQKVMDKNKNIVNVKVPIPPDFQIFGVGIVLKKGNIALKKQVEQAVEKMRFKGKMKTLERKWNIPGVQQ